MWFQSQWAQQQQQTCRPPRRAAAGASEAGKKKDKKKKKNPTSCKESRRRSTSASPLWMSNQLHDSEGGPLFRIKHCNLIMCGLIKGPCVRPQLCTASSTWLDSEIPQGGGGRKEEKKELSSLVFSTRQRRLPPGLAVYLVSASRGVVETLATLRLAATARCLLDKGGQRDPTRTLCFQERHFSFAVLSRRQRDCNHFESFIYFYFVVVVFGKRHNS